jgi:hypothetical protein
VNLQIKPSGESDSSVKETMSSYAAALHPLHRDAKAKQIEGRRRAQGTTAAPVIGGK